MLKHVGVVVVPRAAPLVLRLLPGVIEAIEPVVHPCGVEKPRIVAHKMRKHEVPVGRHVLRRKSVVLLTLLRAVLHLGVEHEHHAQLAGMALGTHNPRPGPVGGAAFKALATVGPGLVQRAQKRNGQPVPFPGVQRAARLNAVILIAGLTVLLVDKAVFRFCQTAQIMSVARLLVGFLLHFLPKIAPQTFDGFLGNGEVEKLRAAAGDNADR